MLHGAQAVARADLQRGEIAGAVIGEFVMLEMTPDVFGGVEFGRIGRQRLDLARKQSSAIDQIKDTNLL